MLKKQNVLFLIFQLIIISSYNASSVAFADSSPWEQTNPLPSYADAIATKESLKKEIEKTTLFLGQILPWTYGQYKISQEIKTLSQTCSPSVAVTIVADGQKKPVLSQYAPIPLAKIEKFTLVQTPYGYALKGIEKGRFIYLFYKTSLSAKKDLTLFNKLLTLCKSYEEVSLMAYTSSGRYNSVTLEENAPSAIPEIKSEMIDHGGFKTYFASSSNEGISMALLKGQESFATRWKQLDELENDPIKKDIKIQVLHWGGDEAGIVLGEKLISLKQKGHNPVIYIDLLSPFADIRDIKLRENNDALYSRLMASGIPVYGYECKFLIGNLFQSQMKDFTQAFETIRKKTKFTASSLDDVFMHWRMNMHEKIWYIDGKDSILGGMNILNTYFDIEEEGPQHWRDQDFLIKNSHISKELSSIIDRNIEDYKELYSDPKKMTCYNPYDVVTQRSKYYDFYNNATVVSSIRDAIVYIISFGLIKSSTYNYYRFEGYNPTSKPVSEASFKSKNPNLYEVNRLKQGIIQRTIKDKYGKKTIKRHTLNDLKFNPIKAYRIIPNRPKKDEHFISDTMITLLDNAKKEVIISMAYFVPEQDIIDAIRRAASRGIKFYIIVNAENTNDLPIMTPMQRSLYKTYMDISLDSKLVNVYEWNGTDIFGEQRRGMLHSKVMIVDRKVVLSGSYNIDNTSENLNSEIMFAAESQELARALIQELNSDYFPFTHLVSYKDALIFKYPKKTSDQAMLTLSTLLRPQW